MSLRFCSSSGTFLLVVVEAHLTIIENNTAMKNKRSKAKTLMSVITIVSLIIAIAAPLIIRQVKAAGIQVYADLTNDTSNPQVPSTVTTQPVIADATLTPIYYSYTGSSLFATSDTIKLTFPTGFTIASCASATTDADNDGTPDGSGAVAGQQYTYTFSAPSTSAAIEVCINTTAPSANAQNYSVAMSSTNDSDYGAVMLYVYDDAGPTYQNRVYVTAQVAPQITLSITTAADAETDDCDLGVLDIVAVNTCSYRVYPGTNQTTGSTTLQITDISTNAGLAKGAGGDIDNIDNTGANTDVAGGTEGYGIEAAGTGSSYTLQGDYASTTDDPIPTSITTFAQATGYINGTVGGGNYLTVTHRAAADAGTQTGSYSQIVQYTLVTDP